MHTLPHGIHGLHDLSVRWVERLISQQAKKGLCHRLAQAPQTVAALQQDDQAATCRDGLS